MKQGRNAGYTSTQLDSSLVISAYKNLRMYTDVPTFDEWYCNSVLLSKTYVGESDHAVAAARQTYVEAQGQNSIVNSRLNRLTPARVPVFHRAREKIKTMLHGRFPTSVETLPTSGASFSHPRNPNGFHDKCSLLENEVTFGCAPLYKRLVKGTLFDVPTKRVPGNRLAYVEKSAETKRAITCEPTLNLLVQRQFGIAFRDALHSVGIDLRDQGLNQRLAQRAYHDALSTLDLKNASNSLSISLCRQLLPWEWFEALMMCRSEVTILPDSSTLELEFMASMGNGFTFELESLVFYALVFSVCGDQDIGVYGDDLICPRDKAPDLIELLEYCGFSTNIDKSFIDGDFFESCGQHYRKGVLVTPHYVRGALDKKTIFDVLSDINGILRWSCRTYGVYRYNLVAPLLALLPPAVRRCRIPDGFGDDGIICDTIPCVFGVYKCNVVTRATRTSTYHSEKYLRGALVYANFSRTVDLDYQIGVMQWNGLFRIASRQYRSTARVTGGTLNNVLSLFRLGS